ncbi:spindle and kinetochore-associated protein 3 isoform X2 [Heterocephalus glaber]|uniref:Spindle and kinetochore-associated protein 3 isoform X2 n=1 Tax=Heterocephalus glaber TaxID=10181 RepID=A0AAX6R556_HETGA|nr:spindle and kinetochore-associated protein 3 isoform X2 [Heterocephalus glaber]
MEFEDDPMRILHDLHSEVWALKDDVNILLDKARLESQESIGFIKATKLLMKKNATDIIKIREFFQKYGYNPRVKENSVSEQEITDFTPKMASCDHVQSPRAKDSLSDPSAPGGSVSEEPLRSPQLADFGLERYMIPQLLPNPPQAVSSHKDEPIIGTPSTRQSVVKILKTPKCALKMDDFECVTPKLEHFGISEYTMCLNEDYTIGLKNMKTIKSEVAVETEPMISDDGFATPGPIMQQLEKRDTKYTDSPLTPTFCTPGLKVPSTKNCTALVPTNYALSETHSSSNDFEVKDCTSLVLSSYQCLENFADPSSPTVSSYENLLRTPTPPEVTAIPEDVLQILSKYKPSYSSSSESSASQKRAPQN